jgi:hypothetical protein
VASMEEVRNSCKISVIRPSSNWEDNTNTVHLLALCYCVSEYADTGYGKSLLALGWVKVLLCLDIGTSYWI